MITKYLVTSRWITLIHSHSFTERVVSLRYVNVKVNDEYVMKTDGSSLKQWKNLK